jgi:RNA polymerase sigma-70 factor (ECF subfamily)
VEAFTALYQRNKSALYRYFLRQTHNNSAAEELSQDVWTNIIRARRGYQADAKFTTYLFQIAHNKLVDYYRRSSHRIHENPEYALLAVNAEDCDPADGPQTHPDRQAEAAQIRQRILTLVQSLPQDQREVFILKEDAGLSVEQIAQITAVNGETAKSRLRYAMNKIREGLKEFL